METAVASIVLKVVIGKLADALAKEIGRIWDVDDELEELKATYMTIKNKLEESDCWQISDTTLKSWLQDLERYCYDTEDLLDDLILSRPITQEDEIPAQHPVRCHVFRSCRLTLARKITKLQKKLQVTGHRIDRVLSKQAHTGVASRKNPFLDQTPFVPGTTRDRDKEIIIQGLTSEGCHSSGVSILGIDGLGKTALARTIMLDERIKDHFPVILSACVDGRFNMEAIVQKLLEDHLRRTRAHNHPQTSESYQRDLILQNLLHSQESLIILDDLWSVTGEDWKHFRDFFLGVSSSWKILSTTRNPKVAKVMVTTAYYLNRLTDDDCKELIMHKANLNTSERTNWAPDIEVIAKKCKGMPIVADKLGTKLSQEQRCAERWDTIVHFKMKNLWELEEFSEVFPSLHLNEPNLSLDCQWCFAYCSLFSPEHEFNRDELIQLWEAEGLTPRDQASRCFDDLLCRSILQPCKSRNNKQQVYKMQEFNHEIARLLASVAFCRVDEGTSNLLSICRNIRHLSLTCQNTDEPLLKKIGQCEGLRTFLLLHQDKPTRRTVSYNFFRELKRLRLLDLSHTSISNLSKPFSPSKHLRYLDLSHSQVKELPEPIHIFHALQTLKLENCTQLLRLPKDLNQLISLKHLHVNMKSLGCPVFNIGKLTNLEVLNCFAVGKYEGCKVAELQNLNHLREISVSGLENIRNREEAQKTMLSVKPYLRTLVLEWDPDIEVENARDVLEDLQPHNHLRDLEVRNYCGEEFPKWLISPSRQLVSIYLDNCQNCQRLPSLGQLPILTTLVLRCLHNVQVVDNEFRGEGERVFPCLELLEFCDMKSLRNWTELQEGDMPCLRHLKISNCQILVNLDSFEWLGCLVNLEINDCPMLQSLPELPSSLNGELGELIIKHSALVEERCNAGNDDWPKIKEIPYVEIGDIKIPTKLSRQPHENDKDEGSTDEHQPSTSLLFNENDVSQNEVSMDKRQPSTSNLVNDNNVSQDEASTNEHQPSSTTNLFNENDDSENELSMDEPQPSTTNLINENNVSQGPVEGKSVDPSTTMTKLDEIKKVDVVDYPYEADFCQDKITGSMHISRRIKSG